MTPGADSIFGWAERIINSLALLFGGWFLHDMRSRIMRLESMFMRPVENFVKRVK